MISEKIDYQPETKKWYKIIDERATDINRPLDSFKAPGIPDGVYDSDTLLEWQNVGFKELSVRHGVKLAHSDFCICDGCLDNFSA